MRTDWHKKPMHDVVREGRKVNAVFRFDEGAL